MKTQINYKKGFKYQLTWGYSVVLLFKPPETITTFFIKFDDTGELWIKRGYAWDGPSGWTIDTDTVMRASLVHDVVYQLLRLSYLTGMRARELADKEFLRVMLEDIEAAAKGIKRKWVRKAYLRWNRRRARVWYKALRIGGGPAASASHRKITYEAGS